MFKVIENVLSTKSISASKEEIEALANQWEAIQHMKKAFKQAELEDWDIAMRHDLRGVYHE